MRKRGSKKGQYRLFVLFCLFVCLFVFVDAFFQRNYFDSVYLLRGKFVVLSILKTPSKNLCLFVCFCGRPLSKELDIPNGI